MAVVRKPESLDVVISNRFRAINQFTLEGSRQLRRPDVICFINGLPLAVLELKSPGAENVNIWDAYNQIQTYKDEKRLPVTTSFMRCVKQ